MDIRQEGQLPEKFRRIMWSSVFETLDHRRDKQLIILQAVNYGELWHWQWIVRTYGMDEVRRVLTRVPVTAIRAHVRTLVSLLFAISAQEYNHASRGTH